MNPLVQIIRENERGFENRFPATQNDPTHYHDCVCWSCNDYRDEVRANIRSREISLLDTIEKWCEEEKVDSKEWVDMMSAAREAGFSNMKSPEDFISGRNFILTLIQNFIIEAKKKI